jgi:RNA polymerase subunit RPABC4/transcription elongation factor Spt4
LWFTLVVWAFRDIESRSRSVVTQVFSTLLVVLFFIPGVLLYLILRPKETLDAAFQRSLEEEYLLQDLEELPLCPKCQHYVEDDFRLCPNCQTSLREACPACARLVDLRWAVCPYCGTDQRRPLPEIAVQEEPARWLPAGAVRRRLRPSVEVTHAELPRESVVAESANGVGDALVAPLRLFDRRRTREMTRTGTSRRLDGQLVRFNGTHGHLHSDNRVSPDSEPTPVVRPPSPTADLGTE